MKLKQAHIFYILLGVLLLSCLGSTIHEGFREGQTTGGGKYESTPPEQGGPPDSRETGKMPATPQTPGQAPNAIPDAGPWGGADPTKPGQAQATSQPPPSAATGIPKDQIPKGDEDLYILKSAVVPPVCPKCPDINVCPDKNETCPPCPPCGRCPAPAFKCKKVPDLKSSNTSYLPQPILTDFSQFSV